MLQQQQQASGARHGALQHPERIEAVLAGPQLDTGAQADTSSSGSGSGGGGSSSAPAGGVGAMHDAHSPHTRQVREAAAARRQLLQDVLDVDEVAGWLEAARAQDVCIVDVR